MELNEGQKKALEIATQRYLKGEKYTVIAGPAGSGKSSTVRAIIENLKNYGIKEEFVVFTSFTGKATQVLQRKGNMNVSTLHKLLYKSYPKKDGSYVHEPVTAIPYKLVIVDEVSMVPSSMSNLLLNYDVHVIFLGDDSQLPPVNKNEDNHLLDNPHAVLTEIMRQDADSEIIQLATKIRMGEKIDFFKGKDVQVIPYNELNTGMLLWADQILVATNETRVRINNQIREMLGRGAAPEEGDKVICLKNYWDHESLVGGAALINGTIGTIKNVKETKKTIYTKPYAIRYDAIEFDFTSDCDDDFGKVNCDKNFLETGEKSINWNDEYKILKNPILRPYLPEEFAYGYAITCWKAQGSEWDKVLIIEESFPYEKEEHRKFLYTAITRGASKIVLVRP